MCLDFCLLFKSVYLICTFFSFGLIFPAAVLCISSLNWGARTPRDILAEFQENTFLAPLLSFVASSQLRLPRNSPAVKASHGWSQSRSQSRFSFSTDSSRPPPTLSLTPVHCPGLLIKPQGAKQRQVSKWKCPVGERLIHQGICTDSRASVFSCFIHFCVQGKIWH